MADTLTAEGLKRLHDVAARHVAEDKIPGLVALVGAGEQVHVETVGTLSVGGPPVARDSLFRIASTTKPVTAAATLALADEGLLGLDEPVDRPLRGGAPVLSADAATAMTSDQLTPAQKAYGGLGRDFFNGQSWGFGQAVLDSGAFDWAGGLGTTWMADPAKDPTVIVLTQRQFESPDTPQAHREIQEAAYAALA